MLSYIPYIHRVSLQCESSDVEQDLISGLRLSHILHIYRVSLQYEFFDEE